MEMTSIKEIDEEIKRLSKEKELLFKDMYKEYMETYLNKYFSCQCKGYNYYFKIIDYNICGDIIYLKCDGYRIMSYLIGDKFITKNSIIKLDLNKILDSLQELTYDEYKNKINTFLESMKLK